MLCFITSPPHPKAPDVPEVVKSPAAHERGSPHGWHVGPVRFHAGQQTRPASPVLRLGEEASRRPVVQCASPQETGSGWLWQGAAAATVPCFCCRLGGLCEEGLWGIRAPHLQTPASQPMDVCTSQPSRRPTRRQAILCCLDNAAPHVHGTCPGGCTSGCWSEPVTFGSHCPGGCPLCVPSRAPSPAVTPNPPLCRSRGESRSGPWGSAGAGGGGRGAPGAASLVSLLVNWPFHRPLFCWPISVFPHGIRTNLCP